jgi:hypothetical protein
MDNIISTYEINKRDDLCYCEDDGVAYQADMNKSVPYDRPYFEKYVLYEKSPLGRMLNMARVGAVKSWADKLKIIDIGIGCGTFVKYALNDSLDVSGFDINPCGVNWLMRRALYDDPYNPHQNYMAYTFWDSLEHIPEPHLLLNKIGLGAFVYVSIPIFESLGDIKKSRHYRPDEHYYYFTSPGFIKWMTAHNFKLKQTYNFETELGRENIKTFLFERVLVKRKHNVEMIRAYFNIQREETKALIHEANHN